MSNYNQFIKDLKKAKQVYGYVVFTEHDGQYLKLTKSDVLQFVRAEDEINYAVNNNNLFLG